MVKKGTPYTNDDGLTSELLDEIGPIWRQIIEPPSTKGNPPAKSKWSTGRSCPRCSGDFKFFEYNEEKDIVYIQCRNCAHVFAEPDLEAHHYHIPDKPEGDLDNINYRAIPLDLINRWMKAREDEKIRKGEWEPLE